MRPYDGVPSMRLAVPFALYGHKALCPYDQFPPVYRAKSRPPLQTGPRHHSSTPPADKRTKPNPRFMQL